MKTRATMLSQLFVPALVVMLASTAVHAEASPALSPTTPLPPLMADPTRPPNSMLSADGLAAGMQTGNRLTSILLPKKGRATAVIDGNVLRLGESLGDARLTRIKENEVVLEGPEGIEHLYLTPDVEKKMKITKGAAGRKKE